MIVIRCQFKDIYCKKLIVVILVCAIGALNINMLYAEAIESLSTIKWEQLFGDKGYSFLNKSLALSPIGNELIISGVYSSLEDNPQTNGIGTWIWKFDSKGKKISEIRLKNMPDGNHKLIDIEALVSEKISNILFVGKLETGEAILKKIDVNEKVLMTKGLVPGQHVSKIIPALNDQFFLIGNQLHDALVIKINAKGVELWSKVIDYGKQDLFVDGITTEEGGLILIGNSGKFEQFFMGSSDIVITEFDPDGNKKHESSFPGRYGSIARGVNDSYAIVYDRSDNMSKDVWIQAYGKNSEMSWELKIAESKFGLEKFKLISLDGGDYVTSGSINLRPWVSFIDSSGKKKWEFDGRSMKPALAFDFISNGKDCFIVSTVIELDENKKPRKQVRVIKFTPKS